MKKIKDFFSNIDKGVKAHIATVCVFITIVCLLLTLASFPKLAIGLGVFCLMIAGVVALAMVFAGGVTVIYNIIYDFVEKYI